LLVVLLPSLWWISAGLVLLVARISVAPIPIIAISMLVLVQLGGKVLNPQRLRDAQSALVGALVIAIALFATADSLIVPKDGFLDSPVVMSLGFVAACLLLTNVRLSAALGSDPRVWLAIALAACCGIGFNVPLKGNLVVLWWLVPLAALAVEAKLSDRSKTFAAVVVVFLGLIVWQMGVVKDLRTFAVVLLAGGAIAMVILLAVRKIGGNAIGGSS
jgi:hypothetical protein